MAIALVSNIAASSTENAGSTTNSSDAVAARTSVFKVLLQCKAAPELACGGGLKRILLELERTPAIEQAWVNTNGTALLMIGSKNSTSASRAQAVQAVVGRRGRQVEELNGDDRDKVMDGFRSGSGWYRSEGVDELSRQAAKAVAARFLRRTKAKVSLSAAKAADLESALSTLLQTSFVNDPAGDPTEDVLKIGRTRLDNADFRAFQEAVASGLYPKPNEG